MSFMYFVNFSHFNLLYKAFRKHLSYFAIRKEKLVKVFNVFDREFGIYGRVIKNIDVTDLIRGMDFTDIPEDVVYEPSDMVLERTSSLNVMTSSIYGGLPVQIGYCNGHNNKLNALEYHRSSEINVAVTDMILLLGRQQDINDDFTYDTSKTEAFLVPAGTAIEVYATTLHYAPCGVDGNGFKCVVVLPKGTNLECDRPQVTAEDRLLMAANKWLIAHKDAHIEGAFEGLIGENITI